MIHSFIYYFVGEDHLIHLDSLTLIYFLLYNSILNVRDTKVNVMHSSKELVVYLRRQKRHSLVLNATIKMYGGSHTGAERGQEEGQAREMQSLGKCTVSEIAV